jgi:hypothetical protein
MKRLWIAAVLLFAAGMAGAAQVETALTDDHLLWTVDGSAARPSLILTLRTADDQPLQQVLVPTTDDSAIDAQPRLAWDAATRTLFVLWRRAGANGDEIRLARRYASGRWAPPIVLANGASAPRAGLQLAITRSKAESTTLVHAVWWTLGARPVAEYGLAAFQGAELLSTSMDALDDLAAVLANATTDEDTGKAVHPPLAMVRSDEGVEVAYGAPRTTAVTRVQIEPRKIASNARIWRPSGKQGRLTPAAGLISATSLPVQSFIIGGNVVLYTPDARFRYVILDEGGKWTPVRMLATDDKLTSDDVVRELRRSIAQHGAATSSADTK